MTTKISTKMEQSTENESTENKIEKENIICKGFEESKFTDICLKCEEEEYIYYYYTTKHQLSFSNVWKVAIENDENCTELHIPEISYKQLDLLLKYFIPVNHVLTEIKNNNYEDLYYLSERFEVDELYEACKKYIMKTQISPSTKLFERVWNTKDRNLILKITDKLMKSDTDTDGIVSPTITKYLMKYFKLKANTGYYSNMTKKQKNEILNIYL